MTEYIIKIDYYDSDVKLVDSIMLPFIGFQWINTEIKIKDRDITVKPHSVKVTIFKRMEAQTNE